MATSTIIITDLYDGRINVKIEFDHKIDMETNTTQSQRCAFSFIEFLKEQHEESEDE
jgi:hypothetical protein